MKEMVDENLKGKKLLMVKNDNGEDVSLCRRIYVINKTQRRFKARQG